MRKIIFAINVTIDGYADHTSGIVDDELHDFYTGFLNSVDIILFGKTTYQLMESYWPNAEKDPEAARCEKDFARKFNAMPKIVFSQTLQIAEWNNSRIERGNLVEEVLKLKKQPGKYISAGSISIFQELMRHNLIDEYWFLVHPIFAGKGKRLFEGLEISNQIELTETKIFKSGVVALHYKNIGG